MTHNEWYDYEAKYDEGEMELDRAGADLPTSGPARVQELAVRAFAARSARGWRASTFSSATTARCS